MSGEDLGTQAAGIGALADDTRRALYEYVVAQPDAVGREQAARALGLPPHSVNFHLDRLVDEGLLDTEFRRLTGRTGPGAGRPSKLYRRAAREFAVTLPSRRYELVGQILAAAVSDVAAGGDLDEALDRRARDEGRTVGHGAVAPNSTPELDSLAEVLATQGYDPRVEDDAVVLTNCPFDSLAKEHTALVCGLNEAFVQGVVEGLGCRGVEACLAPQPGRCCVTARREPASGRS
jgi:predicted ArsR family transcriptional regulator